MLMSWIHKFFFEKNWIHKFFFFFIEELDAQSLQVRIGIIDSGVTQPT